VVLLLATGMLVAAGCNGSADQRLTRVDHRSYAIPRGAHTDLGVATFNGNVSVTAIGLGTADVVVTARASGASPADAQAALDAVQVDEEQGPGTLEITVRAAAEPPNGASHGADVDVQLPVNTSATVATSNGHVEVVNISGMVVIQTSNGAVLTRGGTGVTIATSNSAVSLTEPSGPIAVTTSNGSVDILDARDAILRVGSTDGAISFSGSLAAGEDAITTSDSPLSLKLPAGQGFTIDGNSESGTASTNVDGVTASGGSLQGSFGDGAARITARTSNESLSLTWLVP
jgi:hypothetical protein